MYKTRPVLDGISHESAVDIIKLLAVRPFQLNVIDFEADVGRYPAITLEPCHMAYRIEKHTSEVGWGLNRCLESVYPAQYKPMISDRVLLQQSHTSALGYLSPVHCTLGISTSAMQ